MKKIRIYKREAKKLAVAVDMILIAVFAVSSIALAVTLIRYGENRTRYRDAANEAVALITPTPAVTAAPQAEETPVPVETTRVPSETPPIRVDFESMKKDTQNVIGWIYSEGTPINYPVMLGRNNEYYLTHAYNGDKDKGGAIFGDCRMTRSLTEQNIILFGHHMKNDTMFGSLMEYQKQEYFMAHPVLYFITPSTSYKIEVFAARPTTSEAAYYPLYFESKAARDNFARKAISESTCRGDARIRDDAQIISLVTCSYYGEGADAKFQVHGWLTPLL